VGCCSRSALCWSGGSRDSGSKHAAPVWLARAHGRNRSGGGRSATEEEELAEDEKAELLVIDARDNKEFPGGGGVLLRRRRRCAAKRHSRLMAKVGGERDAAGIGLALSTKGRLGPRRLTLIYEG
jgi:hypothetical protein